MIDEHGYDEPPFDLTDPETLDRLRRWADRRHPGNTGRARHNFHYACPWCREHGHDLAKLLLDQLTATRAARAALEERVGDLETELEALGDLEPPDVAESMDDLRRGAQATRETEDFENVRLRRYPPAGDAEHGDPDILRTATMNRAVRAIHGEVVGPIPATVPDLMAALEASVANAKAARQAHPEAGA